MEIMIRGTVKSYARRLKSANLCPDAIIGKHIVDFFFKIGEVQILYKLYRLDLSWNIYLLKFLFPAR